MCFPFRCQDEEDSSEESSEEQVHDGKSRVQINIWDEHGNLKHVINDQNIRNFDWLKKKKEEVLGIVHDWAESSCSDSIKDMVKKLYANKKEILVATLDYSKYVRGLATKN